MLRIERVSKEFGGFRAVEDLSFSVSEGEIVGLLGPNGAGKTTTLRCIASILQPTQGRIRLCGHDIVKEASQAKRVLAYVPEVPHPYDLLTVIEHLRFVAAAHRMESEMVHAEAILRRLDLWEKRNALAATLSKGMKQKLACACAFVHRARIFLFDEPMIGIDPKGARELKDLLVERRNAGDAVLVSTHMLDTAERLCDRVLIMNRGRKVAEGTIEELHRQMRLAETATLEEMFLQLTGEAAA